MSSVSYNIIFNRACDVTTLQEIGFGLGDDFCRSLVVDEARSPEIQATDPCPHLFLRYYTSSSSPIDVLISQGFIVLQGKVVETVHEVINFTTLNGSLKFCNLGLVDYTWTPLGTNDCPESDDPITISGQDITVPDFGILDIYYETVYWVIEVTPTVGGLDVTAIVCQDGRASTYTFNPIWCGSCSYVVSNTCCKNDPSELVLGDIALAQGAEVVVGCAGGCPPYKWSFFKKPTGVTLTTLAGEDTELPLPASIAANPNCAERPFTVTNNNACLLTASDEACGEGRLTVSDYCGRSADGDLRGLPEC